ncbi:hypothetical protein FRC12_009694 [Ceratobasidium sp. 428]|nr:hypothetical protein FRC12_009694 [Ceratobasidium sp. 428]
MTFLGSGDVRELETELQNIQTTFNKASSLGRHDYRKSELELELLDDLEQRLDDLVKLTELRLQAQSLAASEDDRLDIIKAHEVLDQVVLPLHLQGYRFDYDSESYQKIQDWEGHTCRRSGRRTPKQYVLLLVRDHNTMPEDIFRGRSPRSIYKIRLYTGLSHPNIATIIGVTKGPWLNGIVSTSALLPYEKFLHSVNDPSALARCFRDLLSVQSFFRGRRDVYPLELRMDPTGRVVVTPTNDSRASCSLSLLLFSKGFDPVTKTLASVFNRGLKDFPWPAILDHMVQSRGSFTLLRLYQLADRANAFPMMACLHWLQPQPPPFTILPGEIGTYSGDDYRGDFKWATLSRHQVVKKETIMGYRHLNRWQMFRPPTPTITAGWLTYELPPDITSLSWMTSIPQVASLEWKDLVAHWAREYRTRPREVGLESLSLCMSLKFHIKVVQRNSSADSENIYYHCHPSALSDPTSYWGYLSTNKDPEAQCDNLERQGWEFQYDLICDKLDIADDWGYKYRKLLGESLSRIPGSFPGLLYSEDSESDE